MPSMRHRDNIGYIPKEKAAPTLMFNENLDIEGGVVTDIKSHDEKLKQIA